MRAKIKHQTEMKERPILFSAPMIRAILNGRKTQTRRAMKHPLAIAAKRILSYKNQSEFDCLLSDDSGGIIHCPYGKPGERLWLREAHYCIAEGRQVFYQATGDSNHSAKDAAQGNPPLTWSGPWKPSIHMPRWASRVTLKITSIQVERLQEISEADAESEGAQPYPLLVHPANEDLRHVIGFAALWESINGPGSWDANPWVWAVEFEQAVS